MKNNNIKIEFHVLQSFPPSNLNRDDTNSPKDCDFGGVRRARISSQCIKRSIRLHDDFKKYTSVELGERTRFLAKDLKKILIEAGKEEEIAQKAANKFVSELLGGMDGKNLERSKVLFYVSKEEKQSIVSMLIDNWEDLDEKYADLVKKYKKTFATRNSAPDIALFGRMLADDPKLNLEASCQVAHAISTHKVNMEMDFFVAMDDLLESDEVGAGMMGVTGFNSATFYRYAAIDWGQLTENLGDDIELAKKTIAGFTSAMVKAIPTGKQNAFAAQTPPSFVMVVVREDGQAWSLANAFEKPIKSKREGGYMADSIQAMDKHWGKLDKYYGDVNVPAKPFVLVYDEDCEIINLIENKVSGLSELISTIESALP